MDCELWLECLGGGDRGVLVDLVVRSVPPPYCPKKLSIIYIGDNGKETSSLIPVFGCQF
jgi:hypothetical protein